MVRERAGSEADTGSMTGSYPTTANSMTSTTQSTPVHSNTVPASPFRMMREELQRRSKILEECSVKSLFEARNLYVSIVHYNRPETCINFHYTRPRYSIEWPTPN